MRRHRVHYDVSVMSPGVNVGDRWQDVREIIRPHLDGHRLIFYDYHLAMGCLGLKDDELTKKFMDSLHDFVE